MAYVIDGAGILAASRPCLSVIKKWHASKRRNAALCRVPPAAPLSIASFLSVKEHQRRLRVADRYPCPHAPGCGGRLPDVASRQAEPAPGRSPDSVAWLPGPW